MARSALLSFVVVLLLSGPSIARRSAPAAPAPSPKSSALFVENLGQRPDGVAFHSMPGPNADFYDDRVVVGPVTLRFEGARPVRPVGEDPAITRINIYSGEERREGLGSFTRIRYARPFDGIDIVFRPGPTGLEYDLLCDAGVDAGQVAIKAEGAKGVSIDADGSLAIEGEGGTLRQARPLSWQADARGRRRPVDCTFRRIDDTTYGFSARDLDPALPLVIDPGLELLTGLGDPQNDLVVKVMSDSTGGVVVAGWSSNNMPGGAWFTFSKYDSSLISLQWTTSVAFAGYGSFMTFPGLHDVAIDPTTDDVLVCSDSPQLPVLLGTNLWTVSATPFYSWILRLANTSGIPGAITDAQALPGAGALAVDSTGSIYVAGRTGMSVFPVTPGCLQPAKSGVTDAFVMKFDGALTQYLYSTFLGGSADEDGTCIAVHASGWIAVGGWTQSANFRPAGLPAAAYPTLTSTSNTGFVAVIQTLGLGALDLVNATYLPGPMWTACKALAIDDLDFITVAGISPAPLPAGGPIWTWGPGTGFSSFVLRFPFSLSIVDYGIAIPGVNVRRLVLDESGGAVIGGHENPPGVLLTTTGSMSVPPPYMAPPAQGVVIRMSPAGDRVLYSTLLGWEGGNRVDSLRYADGSLHVGGTAASVNGVPPSSFVPVPGAPYLGWAGGFSDGYLARLDLLPTGVTRIGSASPANYYPTSMGLNPMPTAGTPIDVYCTAASGGPSAGSMGLLVDGSAGSSATTFMFITVYVDLTGPWTAVPISIDGRGHHRFSGTIPGSWTGAHHTLQYVIADPASLRASHAIGVTVQ